MSLRTVNPTEVSLRHIVRCNQGDPGAVQVGGVYFRAEQDGLAGRAGWISGELRSNLSDDSTATVRLANTVGSDGQLHRQRFNIITADRPRLGEEWIEVWREGHVLIGVFTPVSYTVSRTEITLELTDPLALATLTREEGAHPWVGSPRDVLDWYTRLEMPQVLQDLRGLADTAAVTAAGWTFPQGTGGITTGPDGLHIEKTAGIGTALLTRDVTVGDSRNEGWTFRATATPQGGTNPEFRWTIGPLNITVDLVEQTVTVGAGKPVKVESVGDGRPVDLRVWRRGEWCWIAVNGLTIETVRADTFPATVTLAVATSAADLQLVVSRIDLITVEPFLADPAAGDRHLPGRPTPGGLWGRYYAEPDAGARAEGDTGIWEQLILKPDVEPVAQRLDLLNWPLSSPPIWQEPAAGNSWYTVRWTGAIWLDLEASNRNLRVTAGSASRVRLWIGRTGPGVPPHMEGTGTTTGGQLRAHLGRTAGWWPVVIELDHRSGQGGMKLEDRAGSGSYAQVGAERLSPYGVFTDTVQRESYRQMVSQITEAFGFQWTVEPRSLESGEFPGRLIPKVREGRDTPVTVEEDHSTGLDLSGSVADSADRLIVDAAGLATIDGAGNKSVDVISPDAGDHFYLSTASDQASEITDLQLLRQRADSLLALRAGAWEQLKVEPPGQNELVDSWPLTGDLALMRWQPGDGVRLNLPSIGVIDREPRQLTAVNWPLRPDGVGAPQVTWRPRARGARPMLLRALRAAMSARRTYQGRIQTIGGSIGANGTKDSPTTVSVLMLPAGSTISRLEARISYPDGVTGTGEIEVNGAPTGITVSGQSPIDLSHLAAPITATDQRIAVRLTDVTSQLFEIQLSAEVVR